MENDLLLKLINTSPAFKEIFEKAVADRIVELSGEVKEFLRRDTTTLGLHYAMQQAIKARVAELAVAAVDACLEIKIILKT